MKRQTKLTGEIQKNHDYYGRMKALYKQEREYYESVIWYGFLEYPILMR